MTFENILKKKKVYFLMVILSLWFGCIPSPSFAIPVSSHEMEITYTKDREVIDSFLAQEVISKKLAQIGLSQKEIKSRLDKMSGEQVHQLAERIERIKPGSSGSEIIVLVVVLILLGMAFFFLTHTIRVEPREPKTTE